MIILDHKRRIDETWDYSGSYTKEFTHCYHSYPAMMIPQVARRLIEENKNDKTNLIFDPYCGSGTSLVEARLLGIDSIGTDINPLAKLVSKAKVSCFSIDKIEKAKKAILKKISNDKWMELNTEIPDFFNIEYWFKPENIQKLAFLKHFIFNEINDDIRDFYIVPFSETVREASYTRNSEFKLYRIPKKKIESFNVDPFIIFVKKIERNLKGLKAYLQKVDCSSKAEVFTFNTCEEIPNNIIGINDIDLIVTSPPYGDSRTTVAYGQFSRLSNQWLGIEEANQVDKNLMGGIKKENGVEFILNSASSQLSLIKEKDEIRFRDVISFLIDYKNSIDNISPLVSKGGKVCYVVGNRTVKKVNIPLDLITVELFENNGFTHQETIIRGIPSKKMPSKNSPTNEVGKLVSTMNNEFIVILEKK